MLLDDTQIQFTGRWAYHLNSIIPNQFHSFHATNHSGDFVQLNFTGSAIQVFGLTGPGNGNYSVELDGVKSSFSGETDTTQQNLLFSQQNLNPSQQHQIIMTNEIEGRLLTVDLVNITDSTTTGSVSTGSSLSTGRIIAISIVAAICALILAGSLLYLLLRRRRRRPNRDSMTEVAYARRTYPIVLPSERDINGEEERFPWMPDGNVTLGQMMARDDDSAQPYDPYMQRRDAAQLPGVAKPIPLARSPTDDDVVEIVPRTREELDSLRPRVTPITPP
ncbi:hypothetical protein DL93DRAFT_2073529 [Clavulina sp. PMI_390]|nr:hypothetical protein DL93DRAFT_2073529 [Clavulina sp. PMI_390]